MFGSTKESQRRVVGDWIAKNISKCGMTNGQFCRKTNIDRQCLNNWILGNTTYKVFHYPFAVFYKVWNEPRRNFSGDNKEP